MQTGQFQAIWDLKAKTLVIDSDQDRETHLEIGQGAMTAIIRNISLATTSPHICAIKMPVELVYLLGGKEDSRWGLPAMDSRIAEFLPIVLVNLLLTSLQENQAQVQDYMLMYSQDFTNPKTTLQQKDSKMVLRPGFLQVPQQIDLVSIIDQFDKVVIQESQVRTEFLRLTIGQNHLKMKTVVFLTDFMVEAKKEMLQRKDNKI